MKYLIANQTAVLADMAADETIMFPQNAVIRLASQGDTSVQLGTQSSTDADDDDLMRVFHANKNSTLNAERDCMNAIIAAINSDSKLGYTVLFDKLNKVAAPGIDINLGHLVTAG